MSILVIDVGTSSVRAGVVRPDGTLEHVHALPLDHSVPFPGLVEFDPAEMAAAALATARASLAAGGPVEAVGVTAQRASAIAWNSETGKPIGPGIGWQDLRTAGTCIELQKDGIRLGPSETVLKWAWLLDNHDPGRSPSTRLGTVDSWVAWHLTGGALHVTDATNAAVTGVLDVATLDWDRPLAERLHVPTDALPAIVDSTGVLAPATALDGAPPLAGLVGDQQGSLVGQGCTRPGLGKATFGTGAMLDICVGGPGPTEAARGPHGCVPVVTWRERGTVTWGIEAVALTAGSTLDWLVNDLAILSHASESEAVAAACEDTGGVVMVPALLGFGTPSWDFGARGLLIGLSPGSGRAQVTRAVLEGIAHQGADLLEAAEAESGIRLDHLRVDGGMSSNGVFLQALADASQRPVEVSPELEATTLGAGYLAGIAVGTWAGFSDVGEIWSPRTIVEPRDNDTRERWKRAAERAREWYPELSALRF